ncbi:MAG TPA: TorF family putative porin [Rhizomicrobium sp.]|nr:TorF family putative porin [Rhizomicrobium sp.]
MKNSIKLLLGAVSLVGLFGGVSAPALAQDAAAAAPAAPDWALTGYIDVQSDYKFRGISQNKRDPSPQGSLGLTGPDGFYVGVWTSTVDWNLAGQNSNPSVEVDIYGGKHTDLWGVDWNIEPYYYAYPSANAAGGPTADYFELINQLSKPFGPVTLTATWAWSPTFSLGGGTGNYFAGTAAYTINDWLSVSGNLGHQWVQAAKYNGSSDYTYADIGVTATYKGFALDLRYSGTDLNNTTCGFYMGTKHACAGDVVATLTYNFALLP